MFNQDYMEGTPDDLDLNDYFDESMYEQEYQEAFTAPNKNSYNILMVAEKPSIAESIAKALSGGSAKGFKTSVPVYSYRGKFRGKPSNIKVTSVAGHVYTTDFPKKYQNW